MLGLFCLYNGRRRAVLKSGVEYGSLTGVLSPHLIIVGHFLSPNVCYTSSMITSSSPFGFYIDMA